ncbi:low molecular weight phosphotyrosine protein phosphatase [Vibrio ziniensis]|uniref:protein-tyrosine-phosphatase n=1 Tax=Vibrio ziniensis TaxID=2711221 RepID=A0A6G7CGR7_9VIBR|nr:low molecular weight phosphotyrosine protein phosphatase [Vibrio ziniensis]QIH41270.1 low molecular weight phosphotyrosine protein phosphatase [Vibrio ziniensis]
MFSKILVVCVGNICRSPTGEYILKQHLPNKVVDSAGIASKNSGLVGKSADATAIKIAAEHGVDISMHQARQLTPELCSQYDLILVMEKGHINAVSEIAPEARGKTMLFGQWINQRDIPDPYRQSEEAFVHVYELIEQAAQKWASKL